MTPPGHKHDESLPPRPDDEGRPPFRSELQEQEKGPKHLVAALYMGAGGLFFSLTAAAVKGLPSNVLLEMKVFFRALVAVVVTGIIIWRSRDSFVPKNKRLLALRACLGSVAMLGFFTSVTGLPLSEAITLAHLSPFFVALFAAVFLKERLRRVQILAVFVAFGGTLLVVRPGTIPFTFYTAVALMAAVVAGGAHVTLRALRATDSPPVIVFWFSALLLVGSIPFVLARGTPPSGSELLLLLGLGMGGTLGQLCMTNAYRNAPGGEVAIYGYLTVAFSMLWQVTLWDDPLDPMATIGALVIVVGAYINLRSGRAQKKPPTPTRKKHMRPDRMF